VTPGAASYVLTGTLLLHFATCRALIHTLLFAFPTSDATSQG
jgi:hypothetical protein